MRAPTAGLVAAECLVDNAAGRWPALLGIVAGESPLDYDDAESVIDLTAGLMVADLFSLTFGSGDTATIRLLLHRDGWGIVVDCTDDACCAEPLADTSAATVLGGVKRLLIEQEGWSANQFTERASLHCRNLLSPSAFTDLVRAIFDHNNNSEFATADEYLAEFPPIAREMPVAGRPG